FFFHNPSPTPTSPLSLHDALPICTLAHPGSTLGSGHLMAFAALFIVMLAECGRLPVDNPATHLELTMIHEAMILEYSGPYLALVDRKSTRLNSSHVSISYAVFCLK